MRKILTFLLLFFIQGFVFAQDDVYGTGDSFGSEYSRLKKELNKGGYLTKVGWQIKVGDTLVFGRGTLPNHYFAFAYDSPASWSNILGGSNNSYDNKSSSIDGYNKRYITSDFRDRGVVVKKFQLIGNKKIGLKTIVVVGVGSATNYWIEIDNAIEDGEIKVPKEFASKIKSTINQATPSTSVADELKKYKDLLDSGAITQSEYDVVKKKLLGL